MNFDPLYAFLFAGLFSPGPNVIMLTASGARFGFARTLPHLAGVVVGVGLIGLAVGFGIGAVIRTSPTLELVLKLLSAGWILFLAWALFNASRAATDDAARPFTFVEAVLFQAINPKVWAVAFAAAAGFSAGLPPWGEALRLGSGFSGVNLFVCLFWAMSGHLLRRVLADRRIWRGFMAVMAALLAATAALVFV